MQKSHSKLSGFLRRSGLYLEIGLDVVKTYQQQRRARHALSRLKRQHFLGAGSQQGTGLLQVTTTGSGQQTGAGSGQQTGSGAGSGQQTGSGAGSGQQTGAGAGSGQQTGAGAGSGQQTGAGAGQQTGLGAGQHFGLQHLARIEGRLQQRSNRPASKFSAAMTKVITAAMVNTNLFI